MYDRILVPTDGSPGSEAALELGLDLARSVDAEVHVLFAVDPRPFPGIDLAGDETLEQATMEAGRQAVSRARERAAEVGVEINQTITSGVPHVAIRGHVEDNDIECVVMGTRGRTADDPRAFGSTTERVLREADVPVLTMGATCGPNDVAGEDGVSFREVFVPTDGSDAGMRAAEAAIAFAGQFDGSVHACYVVDTGIFEYEDAPRSLLGPLREGGREALREVEAMASEADVSVTTDLLQGTPHRQIVGYADRIGADLIALGRRGRTGLPEVLLGSTTARVVRSARAPVLSVT